jgi:23S rRNA pseudouridine2605 synthase
MKDIPVRVYPIGRLDMDSEGLLLLTNDGELANKLTHPRHEIPKIYHVKIAGTVTQDQLKALGKPMNIDGYTIQPVEVKLISIQQDHCVLRMTLYEGRNRQIRKMCQTQMLSILTLRRIAIGNLELGNLAPGQWRYLTQSQVQYLKSNGANAKKR